MKRRAFFGVMGGAAVAGPQVAKEVASRVAGLDSLRLTGGLLGPGEHLGSTYGLNQFASQADKASDAVGEAQRMLTKLVGITAAQRARVKRDTRVGSLDPDIESYRSLSLVFKIDMQKEREVEARLNQGKTMWERIANGVAAIGEDDYLPI